MLKDCTLGGYYSLGVKVCHRRRLTRSLAVQEEVATKSRSGHGFSHAKLSALLITVVSSLRHI